MSGQSLDVQKQDTFRVSYVKAALDVLREMEAPVGKGSNWPEFPMSLVDGMFVVGLLWRSEERPADNRQQAFAAAKSQVRKLEDNTDARRAYDQALLQEYVQLGALEVEPNPETEG